MANADLIVPRFFIHTVQDAKKSKEEGRPIFKDIECVEIRMAANKQTVAVFPAHEFWAWGEIDGIRQKITYAMRFADQYKRFKASEAQVMTGTPLEELPFLTQAKRSELKALSIYTAEALATLDGQPLKQLGMGGRELKTQAEAYLAKATDSAAVTRLAAENETLRAALAQMQIAQSAPASSRVATPFDDMDEESLKEWIKDASGSRPRGNPSIETLRRMANEINDDLKAKKAEAA
jgi:type VI protein secretion system component VasK